jgi:hypothetical protein
MRVAVTLSMIACGTSLLGAQGVRISLGQGASRC